MSQGTWCKNHSEHVQGLENSIQLPTISIIGEKLQNYVENFEARKGFMTLNLDMNLSQVLEWEATDYNGAGGLVCMGLSRIYRLFVTLHHHITIQLLLMDHFVAVCKAPSKEKHRKEENWSPGACGLEGEWHILYHLPFGMSESLSSLIKISCKSLI